MPEMSCATSRHAHLFLTVGFMRCNLPANVTGAYKSASANRIRCEELKGTLTASPHLIQHIRSFSINVEGETTSTSVLAPIRLFDLSHLRVLSIRGQQKFLG
jgi:hypothetical protein